MVEDLHGLSVKFAELMLIEGIFTISHNYFVWAGTLNEEECK